MTQQLQMRYGNEDPLHRAWWQEMLEEITNVVIPHVGIKQVCFDLDVSPSYLSNCLAERERHRVWAEWIPYFVLRSPTDRLAKLSVGIRALDVSPVEELTPEQRLERLERAMVEELGPAVRKAIAEKAWGPKP